MNLYLSELVERYQSKGVLVDTNLLLLLIIGSADRDLVSKFKRTKQFTAEDFDLLYKFLELFKAIYTTPHVLTEVGNLANTLPMDQKPLFAETFREIGQLFEEKHALFKLLSNKPEFVAYGLTDVSILELAPEQALILTDDFPLANNAQNQGLDVINFNHIRFYL